MFEIKFGAGLRNERQTNDTSLQDESMQKYKNEFSVDKFVTPLFFI